MTTSDILKNAKSAKSCLCNKSAEDINSVLVSISNKLKERYDDILNANRLDVDAAKERLSSVMIDRLSLDYDRICAIADSILEVVELDCPVNKIVDTVTRPNGLVINKVLVPMGVVAVIYESRPNVTADVAALCLKSGNVSVLRSGKDAWRTSNEIVKIIKKALVENGFDENCVNLIEDTSHDSVNELLCAVDYIDLLIPRGGAKLIKAVTDNAKVPCVKTGTGICHIYVDKSADLSMAVKIINNAKTSRPSVCNAEEVCLVHRDVADKFLPMLKNELVDKRIQNGQTPVELRLCEESAEIIEGTPAGENDFDTEFLDYILAVKIVSDVDEAISHISVHSTGHSESCIAGDECVKTRFLHSVDSAAVYVNASTRFTDGGVFGLGCEIGISTQKLHARGPMGLRELCSYKYVIIGEGQIR